MDWRRDCLRLPSTVSSDFDVGIFPHVVDLRSELAGRRSSRVSHYIFPMKIPCDAAFRQKFFDHVLLLLLLFGQTRNLNSESEPMLITNHPDTSSIVGIAQTGFEIVDLRSLH